MVTVEGVVGVLTVGAVFGVVGILGLGRVEGVVGVLTVVVVVRVCIV